MDEGRQFRVHPGYHRLEALRRLFGRFGRLFNPFQTSLILFTLPEWTIHDHT